MCSLKRPPRREMCVRGLGDSLRVPVCRCVGRSVCWGLRSDRKPSGRRVAPLVKPLRCVISAPTPPPRRRHRGCESGTLAFHKSPKNASRTGPILPGEATGYFWEPAKQRIIKNRQCYHVCSTTRTFSATGIFYFILFFFKCSGKSKVVILRP